MKTKFKLLAISIGMGVLSQIAQGQIAATLISSINLSSDLQLAANSPLQDILVNRFTSENLNPLYQVYASGVALVQNVGQTRGSFDVIVANSSPLCGSNSQPPYGPARVMTVTIDPGQIVPVRVAVIDFTAGGTTSFAHLQIRHATVPLVVKTNSFLNVLMWPTNGANNTPNEGPPAEGNCP